MARRGWGLPTSFRTLGSYISAPQSGPLFISAIPWDQEPASGDDVRFRALQPALTAARLPARERTFASKSATLRIAGRAVELRHMPVPVRAHHAGDHPCKKRRSQFFTRQSHLRRSAGCVRTQSPADTRTGAPTSLSHCAAQVWMWSRLPCRQILPQRLIVFPDTHDGICEAGAAGASVLWANTVLFEGHPLETALADFDVIGQLPAAMQAFDDKFETNSLLAKAGLPVARSFLLSGTAKANVCALADVEKACADRDMSFPMIVKPVRGRGSQGVTLVENLCELRDAAAALIEAATFGDMLMVEEFLGGDEMTVTVMPPASPRPDGSTALMHGALQPVYRFNRRGGVAPYNGDVPVSANSAAIDDGRLRDPAIVAMIDGCVAAALVDARAAIRIDCRADRRGAFKLFDLNMKPNMTGPGRPGRDDQDCLSAIAARADGWSYADLLQAMLAAKWRLAQTSGA